MEDYRHIKCQCGGIIGMYNRDTFNCERCNKEYQLHKLNYDICLINDKTGWIFPMKLKQENKIMVKVNCQEFAPQQHLYEKYGLPEVQSQREGHLFVCSHCLAAIESHEGKQATMEHYVDEDDEEESKCDWCEESGFCTLYEIL